MSPLTLTLHCEKQKRKHQANTHLISEEIEENGDEKGKQADTNGDDQANLEEMLELGEETQ